MRYLTILAIVGAVSLAATGELTVELRSVDNSSCSELSGYVTQDIVINTTSDWLGAQLVVVLDSPGQIYQHPFNSTHNSPDPDLITNGAPPTIDPMPELAFDTYVSNGVLGESVPTLTPVDLGGTEKVFSEDEISILWFTTESDDFGELSLARISLSDTANGTWAFLVTAAPSDGPTIEIGGKVIDGVMYVAGDLNASGRVSQIDLDIILDSFGASVPIGDRADPTGDGFVDESDLDVVRRYWGYGYFPVRWKDE